MANSYSWPTLPNTGEQDFERKVRNVLETWRKNGSSIDNEITQARQGKKSLAEITQYVIEAVTGYTSLKGRFDSEEQRIASIESFLEGNSTFDPQDISDLDVLLQAANQILIMLNSLSLPFEYGLVFRGTATFNSTAGVTISLPHTYPSVESYSVAITPRSSSGFIGEIWVERATNAFTVYNSGSDDYTEFEYIVFVNEYLKPRKTSL